MNGSTNNTEARSLAEQLGNALRRRRWQIVTVAAATFAVATLVIARVPASYKASAMIVVDDVQLPVEYVHSTVLGDPEPRMKVLREKLLGVTALTTVVKEFKLYHKNRLGMDARVDELRKHLDVKVDGTTSFNVSYEAGDPATAAAVVNRLADTAIATQTQTRMNRAKETVAFLQKEISQLRPNLEKAEADLRHYKLEHTGALPEELDANLREMEQSRLLLGRTSEMLASATARRRSLVTEAATALRRDEDELSRSLIDARARYTAQHPERRRLEAEHNAAVARRRAEEQHLVATAMGSSAVRESDREIGDMKAMIGSLNQRVKLHEARVSETAKHSDELAVILRDYTNFKDKYAGLSTRLFEAELSLGIERKFQSSRFSLLDRATPPSVASKPNRPELALIAFVVSILLSLGIAVIREAMDRSVHDPKGVRTAFGALPVLACIPRMGRVRHRVLPPGSTGLLSPQGALAPRKGY